MALGFFLFGNCNICYAQNEALLLFLWSILKKKYEPKFEIA